MNPLSIRTACSADAPAIREHVMRVLAESNAFIPFTPEEYEEPRLSEILESDNSNFLVAVLDKEIVGVLECKGGKARAMHHVTSLSMS
ncbi:MAG: hypothetical protein ACU843_17295, partial [Gammaproteobacteria bacterium]